jgi:protein-disulfide isomerase
MSSIRRTARRIAMVTLAAPICLALVACGDSGAEQGASASGEPVAEVAPPAGQQWADVATITPEGGWLAGNPEAPIKLVEYGSLTCPACANFSTSSAQPLRDTYINSGRVSYELRSVPLHGAVDLLLTRLLECAPKEAVHPLAEQIWANLDTLLAPIQANSAALNQALALPENQRFVAFAEQAQLLDFFAARGVSTDQARQCLSDGAAMQALAERLQSQSEADQVTGTPTFFLNGNRIDGIAWSEIETALQQAGAR